MGQVEELAGITIDITRDVLDVTLARAPQVPDFTWSQTCRCGIKRHWHSWRWATHRVSWRVYYEDGEYSIYGEYRCVWCGVVIEPRTKDDPQWMSGRREFAPGRASVSGTFELAQRADLADIEPFTQFDLARLGYKPLSGMGVMTACMDGISHWRATGPFALQAQGG